MWALGVVCGLLLLMVLAGAALSARLLWQVWKRGPGVQIAARLTAALLLLGLTAGFFATLVGLLRALAAVGGERVDPSQKARALAESISAAMNATAAGLAIVVPSLIVLLLLKRRGKQRP